MKRKEIIKRAGKLGIQLIEGGLLDEVEAAINEYEGDGYEFDKAETTLELLLMIMTGKMEPSFKLGNYRIPNEKNGDNPSYSHAMTKIFVGEEEVITSEEGSGPVNALDNSLRKALVEFFPAMRDVRLTDFQVRIANGTSSTDATVAVYMESQFDGALIKTMSVSKDILEATWYALRDRYQYALYLSEINRKKKTG